MTEFQNKVVLITGASSGIGAEMARQLVTQGARVGGIARRGHLLRELAEELGDGFAWVQADVCDTVALHDGLDELAAKLGPVDIIVANAGIANPDVAEQPQAGTAELMYDTNMMGMLRMIDWALPRFLERGRGQIVGVSSLASYVGFPASPSYSGSKAAMRVHLQGLRVALRPEGIPVTTLCPGFIESPMTADADFRMPFKWPTDKAVAYMLRAIADGKAEVAFPLPMQLAVKAISRLPASWTERALGLG